MQKATLRLSWTSFFVPATLIYVIGLLMVYDASSGELVDLVSSKNEFGPFLRQLCSGLVSLSIASALYRIGWQRLVVRARHIYLFLVVLLLLVLVPGLGMKANGARRWILFFGFSIQPSEFVKLFLPAFYLDWLTRRGDKVYGSYTGFVQMLLPLVLPLVLIAAEPNSGTVGVLTLSMGLLFVTTKLPWRYWLLPSCLVASALCLFAYSSSYVQSRLRAYKDPECDIRGKGHQPYQAKIAAGSGGLFGRGPAKSVQKLSYLPEAQNDYIAAIYAEEFGFIGVCSLLALYGWLLFAMARRVAKMVDIVPFTWGVSMMFLLSLQTFMNLGVVSGLLPSTGLNLPFFSQGGSSLIANASALGILASMGSSET